VREVVVWRGSKRIVFIGDIKKQKKRQGKRFYDKEVEEALKKIWYILDFLCGRRLADYMEEILPKLEKLGEIEINPEVRKKIVKNKWKDYRQDIKRRKEKMEDKREERDKT